MFKILQALYHETMKLNKECTDVVPSCLNWFQDGTSLDITEPFLTGPNDTHVMHIHAHIHVCIYIYTYRTCKYICHMFISNDINTYGHIATQQGQELETTYFLSLSPKVSNLLYLYQSMWHTQTVILWPRGVRMPVQCNRAVGLPRHR